MILARHVILEKSSQKSVHKIKLLSHGIFRHGRICNKNIKKNNSSNGLLMS